MKVLKIILCLVILTFIISADLSYQDDNSEITKEHEFNKEKNINQPCLYGTVKEVLEFIKTKIQSIDKITEYYSIRKLSEKVLELYTKSLRANEQKDSLIFLKKAIDELKSKIDWLKDAKENISFLENSSEIVRELHLILSSLYKTVSKIDIKDKISIFLNHLSLRLILVHLEANYKDTMICLPSSELENSTELNELFKEMKQLIKEGKCIDTITGLGDTVTKITDDIMASMKGEYFNIWSLSNKSLIYTFPLFEFSSNPVVKITDDIIATFSKETIEVFSISNRVKISTFDSRQPINSLIKVTDDIIAKGGYGEGQYPGLIELWSISSKSVIDSFKEFKGVVNCLARITDDIIVGGSGDNTIKIWYLKNKWIGTLIGHTDEVNCLARITDDIIVSGSTDKTIKVWSLISKSLLATLVDTCSIKIIEKITDDIIATSCDSENIIKVWSLSSKSVLTTLTGHEHSPNSIQRIDDNTIMSATYNEIKIWSLN